MKPLNTQGAPLIKGLTNNPHTNAITTKLVHDPNTRSRLAPTGFMKRIAGEQSEAMIDARNTEEISPDLTRMANIIISTTIAPNDLVSAKVNYTTEDSNLPVDLQSKMLDVVQTFFDKDYKINDIHKDVLKRALFTDGSVPMLVIPESSLDAIINGEGISMESFRNGNIKEIPNNGILGKPSTESKFFLDKCKRKVSVESSGSINIKLEPTKKETRSVGLGQFDVTDNIDILKMGHYRKVTQRSRVGSEYASSMESLSYVEPGEKEGEEKEIKLKPSDIAALFHQRTGTTKDGSITVKTPEQLGRQNKGHGLVMYLPHDSTIPVHVPGDPSNHYGYYVLLENGYPLSKGSVNGYINKNNFLDSNSSTNSTMIQSLKDELGADVYTSKDQLQLDELRDKFKDKIVQNLKERIANGKYGEEVDLPEIHAAYSIMLGRALEQKMTQVLFIPRELMTYVAFDYDENGMGVSLHKKNKMINVTRSTLSFANTMANINNAVNRKKVNITINPEDVDPDESLITILSNIQQQEYDAYPLNKTNPFSLYNSLSRSGITTTIDGHPDMQGSKVDVEHIRSDNTMVDTSYYETIKEEQYHAYGVIPELMQSSASSDFAIDSIQRNLLFNQSTIVRQGIYNEHITDHCQKYTLNSGTLMGKLVKEVAKFRHVVNDEVKETYQEVSGNEMQEVSSIAEMTVMEIIVDFLKSMRVKLPTLDNNELKSQLEAYSTAKEAISTFADEMLPDSKMELLYGTDYREKANAIKETLKSYLMRRFMVENNVMKDFLDVTGDDESVMSEIKSQLDNQAGLCSAINVILEEIKKAVEGDSTEDNGGY